MPIDWFTVVAQAINFLILVWLLRRFLYKPILIAIDAREQGIATQLTAAKSKRADAQAERDDFRHKNETFDQERAALMAKAADEAKTERTRLLDETRAASDSLRIDRKIAFQNEQRQLKKEIGRRTQDEVFAVARKALRDLANASLEEQVVKLFIGLLRTLDGSGKEQLSIALKTSTEPAHVRSAFELAEPQRLAIEIAIKEIFAMETNLQFQTSPDLIAGIELSTNGQRVGWNVADYLLTMEQRLADVPRDDVPAVAKPGMSGVGFSEMEVKKPEVHPAGPIATPPGTSS